MEKLAGYYDGDNYIQHNPLIPDQLSGLGKALSEWVSKYYYEVRQYPYGIR